MQLLKLAQESQVDMGQLTFLPLPRYHAFLDLGTIKAPIPCFGKLPQDY